MEVASSLLKLGRDPSLTFVRWWLQEESRNYGVQLQLSPPSLLLYTNTSQTFWGMHLQDLRAAGTWTAEEKKLYISILETRAVQLALDTFIDRVIGEHLVFMSNNTIVVAYLKKARRGLVS